MTAGATEALARFAATTRWPDVPEQVREKVLLHTLDVLAVAAAGSACWWNALVREHTLAEAAPGPCTVLGSPQGCAAQGAAQANATAAHGIEIDDFHLPAAVHAGCVVVPTTLAVAEAAALSSRTFVTAVAVGFETVIRLGLAFSPQLTTDRGFHVTSAFGPFGAAAAAASLLGLRTDATHAALGIAAAQAGGSTEYTRSGGEVKRLHAGLAAAAGIRAADLARRGLTAPARSIEGERGFAAAFAGSRADLDRLTDGLGERWHLDGLGVKRWSVCTGNHAPIAAASALRADGLRAEDIQAVTVRVDQVTATHCGHIGPEPRDMSSAQFSTHLAVALRLLGRSNDLADYEELAARGWMDPPVRNLARRVQVEIGAAEDAAFGTAPTATVVAECRDGGVVSATAQAPGSPADPLGWAEVLDKARGLADPHLGVGEIDRIAEELHAWRHAERPVIGLLRKSTAEATAACDSAAR